MLVTVNRTDFFFDFSVQHSAFKILTLFSSVQLNELKRRSFFIQFKQPASNPFPPPQNIVYNKVPLTSPQVGYAVQRREAHVGADVPGQEDVEKRVSKRFTLCFFFSLKTIQ